MEKRSKPPKPIKDLVQGLLKGWGLDRLSREQRVFAVWKEAMGEPLSRHTRPVAVHQGRLVVAAKDSAWMQELQFMKEEIKKKLNQHLGSNLIQDVRFKIGAWEDDEDEAIETEEEHDLDPSLVAEARAAASVIADPRLREQVLRTLLASAKREDAEEREEDE